MTTMHTPGPWSVTEWSSKDGDGAVDACGLQVVGQNGYSVDSCTVEGDGAQCEANVYLMAAAPEMIAMIVRTYYRLAAIRSQWPGRDTIAGQKPLCDMRDLIAKALNMSDRDVYEGGAIDKVGAP